MVKKEMEAPALIGDMLLIHGCTERQMAAIDHILEAVERNLTSVNLSVVGMRAMASACGKVSRLDAEAVLWTFQELLFAIREQRNSVAGLIGKRKEQVAA